jgi:ABC-type uncharacterized transport system ATPase subunit
VLDEAAIADLGIGRKFQKPTVFESHTVEDNLALALKGPRGVFSNLFIGLNAGGEARIDEILDIVKLEARARCSRPTSATARSNGSRSACCSRRTRRSSSSTSPSPA